MSKIEQQQNIYNALRAANLDIRDMAKGLDYAGTRKWFRDFGTISWDAGQRTGKTVWIGKTLTPEDLLVCSGWLRDVIMIEHPEYESCLVASNELPTESPRKYQRIIIEAATWADLDTIYGLTNANTTLDTLYVCVG